MLWLRNPVDTPKFELTQNKDAEFLQSGKDDPGTIFEFECQSGLEPLGRSKCCRIHENVERMRRRYGEELNEREREGRKLMDERSRLCSSVTESKTSEVLSKIRISDEGRREGKKEGKIEGKIETRV